MECQKLQCPQEDKAFNYPTMTTASNYTNLKKSKILYHQYVFKKNNLSVCNINPNATYKSYQQRINILRGCLWNRKICLKECEKIEL